MSHLKAVNTACHLPKPGQKETENLDIPITSNKMKSVTKELKTHKSLGPDGFTNEFYQTLQE